LHIDSYNGYDIYAQYYGTGRFRVYNGATERFRVDTDGITYAYSQFRTPLIYDNDDTGYYINPNSVSQFSSLLVNNAVSNNTGLALRNINPNGGAYSTTASSVSGAIRITLPSMAGLYPMVRFTVRVYTYDGLSFDIYCGGHISGGPWYNTFAYMVTKDRPALSVRFGYSGSTNYVYIGELAQTWAYPQVFIVDVQDGYSAYDYSYWNSGWAIGFETSAFATVSATHTVYPFTFTSNNTNPAYASIYYDANNTGYYIDPASTSNINAMTMAGTLNMWAGSYDGLITFGSSAGWRCGIRQYDSSNAELRMYASNALGKIFFATGYDGASTTTLPTDGMMLYSNNVGIGNFSASSPVSKLHVKASAPSGLGSLPSGVVGTFDSSGNNYLLFRNSADNATYSGIAFQDNNIGGYVLFGNYGANPSDQIAIAGYGGGILQYGAADSISPAARTTIASWNSTGLQVNNGDFRAPIFYDSNNTAYYLDPAGNSYLNSTYFDFAPSTVNFRITTGPGTFNIGDDDIVNLGTSASARSPIFYDYNNTAYYCDPNGTTNINALNLNSDQYIYSSYPTIHFVDSDERGAAIHVNSNLFYILSSNGTGGTSWSQNSGQWPFYINLNDNNATFGGAIYAVGNITAYSDIKLKENIYTIDSALDKVLQLRGVYYNLKRDENKIRKIGVVAQEIQTILPEVVHLHRDEEDKEGTLAVDYGNITAILIEAIKEQQAQIDKLNSIVGRLSNLI